MSSEDDRGQFDLSRRKLLGSVATIGAAGAIGGAGTMAFFSDEEEFANNQITAGELDLKIDWEEHYSDWKGAEADEATMGDPASADYVLPAFDLTEFEDEATGDAGGQIGPLADGLDMEPLDGQPIALNFVNSQDAFWDATSIEAFPDSDGDGIQDLDAIRDICDYDADLDGVLSDDLRTSGTVEGQTTNPGDPLVNLEDVKPGDFGEITFSLHLCDNPGYVWLTSDLVDADENGNTEPEAADEDEYGPGEGPQADLFDNEGDEANEESTDPRQTEQERVELLDYVLTRAWYDDGGGEPANEGNNQLDEIGGELDIVIATDTSGSLESGEIQNLQVGVNNFLTALEDSAADVLVGTVQFGDGSVSIGNDLDSPGNVNVSLPSSGDGNTPLPPALDIADQLVNGSSNARSGAEKAIVVFTDGGPNYTNSSFSAGAYSAPRDTSADWSAVSGDNTYDNGSAGGNVTADEMDETLIVAESIKAGGTTISTVFVGDDDQEAMTSGAISKYGSLPTFLATGEVGLMGDNGVASTGTDAFDVDLDNLSELANQLVSLITTAEDVFFFGTLRQFIQDGSMGNGIPLAGDISAEEAGGTGRNCFSNSDDHFIAVEWWLPINHGNQVQGDSVSFDIGFYTEQCRHNEGSGMANS
jgi:predicted ribosomally synthesized peptide with SipW-like signal peptide